jgi:hypothetical protein
MDLERVTFTLRAEQHAAAGTYNSHFWLQFPQVTPPKIHSNTSVTSRLHYICTSLMMETLFQAKINTLMPTDTYEPLPLPPGIKSCNYQRSSVADIIRTFQQASALTQIHLVTLWLATIYS